MNIPKIYAVCLSGYTNGFSHGKWIDCDGNCDSIMANIKAMLSNSPMAKIQACEEWAIHAYEDFQGISIGEYESINDIIKIVSKLKEHGEAFAAFLDFWSLTDINEFDSSYQGCYKSEEEFIEQYYNDAGITKQIEAAGLQSIYIDFELITTDRFVDTYVGIKRGCETVYVFRRF
jgi:antirestriction protein